jgi:hypothetical protein
LRENGIILGIKCLGEITLIPICALT